MVVVVVVIAVVVESEEIKSEEFGWRKSDSASATVVGPVPAMPVRACLPTLKISPRALSLYTEEGATLN